MSTEISMFPSFPPTYQPELRLGVTLLLAFILRWASIQNQSGRQLRRQDEDCSGRR